MEKLTCFGVFVLKSIIFSLIFWAIWIGVIRPITSATSDSSNASSQSQEDDQESLMKKYWEQAYRADKLQDQYEISIDVSKNQQRRLDALLTKQEEQANRLDSILSSWEKQSQ